MAQEAIKQLFELIDEGVFQPVLQSDEMQLPASKRSQLAPVKRAIAAQREQFQNCSSDAEVYQLYHEQVATGDNSKISHTLHELELPSLNDCREQVESAATILFDEGRQLHHLELRP